MRLILHAANIKKQYGIRTVLDIDKFQVYEGDKIGVVGLNGAGKSTLLGILSGDITADEGYIDCRCNVGYIRQFDETDPTLSGGGNVKRRGAQETAVEDSIIFADEPTANLDMDGVKWVRSKLLEAKTVLLISHDRDLLDDICTAIIEVKDGKLNRFTGNYSDYEAAAKLAAEQLLQKHAEFARKKEQLLQAVRVKEKKVSRQKSRKKSELKKNPSEARLGGHKRAASMKQQEKEAKVLKARIDKLEDAPAPRREPKFRMDFSLTDPPQNKIVLSGEEIHFAYGDRIVFDSAAFSIPGGAKIAVTGRNGAGKTTLLRMIHNKDLQIRIAPKLKMGYLFQGLENLDGSKTVLENCLHASVQDRAATYSILAGLLFRGDDFGKKAEVLSGGERIRLSLAMLISSDCNGLMLDEPTNYLDIRSIEAVRSMVIEYPGTVIVVSHDSRFVRETATHELRVDSGKILAVNMPV
ncbi:MAG: ATP-binding cassette domain-containing protein [Oscillospiraceae bacterium]|nr:ATP-binding cassette domain-containing protein [Oscillospiraceae bacterium]